MLKSFASANSFQPDLIEAYTKLSLQICYLLRLILLLRLYQFLCTDIFPTTPEGLTQGYHIFINNLCFQIKYFLGGVSSL